MPAPKFLRFIYSTNIDRASPVFCTLLGGEGTLTGTLWGTPPREPEGIRDRRVLNLSSGS